jgi:ribA/ribD-fused uncharacterized protein
VTRKNSAVLVRPVDRFAGRYAFLSNFYPSSVEMDGDTYPTVEHAFQAAKAPGGNKVRKLIRDVPTPGEAKRIGRQVTLRENWDEVRLGVMEDLLRAKFANDELASMLLSTAPRPLIEGNTWGDRFWGCVLVKRTTPWDGDNAVPCWDGQNHLGSLLMKVRDDLERS